MTFGKLIDGNLKKFKNPLKTETGDIFTNDETLLLQYGWKKVIYTDAPETEEGYYAVSSWEESETTITQFWTIVPIEESEE